jgi:hypothetical protein
VVERSTAYKEEKTGFLNTQASAANPTLGVFISNTVYTFCKNASPTNQPATRKVTKSVQAPYIAKGRQLTDGVVGYTTKAFRRTLCYWAHVE